MLGREQGAGVGGLGFRIQDSQPPFLSKDYELQLVTYKAQVEPVVSPAKKPKFQSASDSIIQEVRGQGEVGPLGSS